MWLAIVETRYTTYAVAKTKDEAKIAALKSAQTWLERRGIHYQTLKEIEADLGCNTYQIPLGGAIQEG